MDETLLDALAPEAEEHLAVVAMVGRFPGADSVEALWRNLVDEVEAVADSPEEDLLAVGVRRETLDDPTYVRRAGRIRGVELFDAAFFGFSPREAALLDPQHRLFLEHCWIALEEAGHDPRRFPGAVGVYGGVAPNGYFFHHLLPGGDLLNTPGVMDAFTGSDKDFLSTRVSYKLGLTGPSVSVQTACSTSLVAVHVACQGVLSGECDMALAGGVAVRVPQETGYFYSPAGIMSPDGRCRAYSADAAGATGGNGVGVVVLRRLSEALADGDPVRAVILGSAINNDGARRVGYAAPSIEGQTAAIVEALAVADVHPDTVGYVEGHGSGTPLGDPIEVAALNAAYRASGSSLRPASTALGSIKTGIGHLDSAAGVAGLIKAALVVERGQVPASLHFDRPNPKIDFAAGPFFVADRTIPFPDRSTDDGDPADGEPRAPRRAGVSSFGMGGTNAHVVLEEPPEVAPSGPSRPAQLLVLSAATESAVESACDRLAEHLADHPAQPLADVAWTLQVGRQVMRHRRALVTGDDPAAAASALGARDGLLVGAGERLDRPVAFLLPGLGEHSVGMGRGLYEREPVFRAELDRIAELLEPHLERDLRELLYPDGPDGDGTGGFAALVGRGALRRASALDDTALAQPALFAVEVALGRTWLAWGLVPEVIAGYSLGELAAATLAGVFELDDACRLVALRARWISELPPGAMTAVPLGRGEVAGLLGESGPELAIAAVNGPELVVVSGPPEAVAAFEERLAADRELPCRRLATTHAFHAPVMGRIAGDLGRLLAEMRLSPPVLGWVSTVTGERMDGAAATDPDHWVRHLTEPVLFERAMETVWEEPARALLEVGPGASLTSLALQLAPASTAEAPVAVASLGSGTVGDDQRRLLGALARLWLAGLPVDWHGFAAGERRRRLVLPTYPFERQRFWVDAVPRGVDSVLRAPAPGAPAARETEATATSAPAPAGSLSMAAHPRPALASPLVAPRDRLEERLAALWSELLGVEPVGVEDDFFELGGHSLLATRLVARLFRDLGVRLELMTLFDAPTVAGLATTLEGLSDAARAQRRQSPIAWAGAPAATPATTTPADEEAITRRPDPQRPAPLSFAQQRIWLLDRMEPESALYNLPFIARLRGRLDAARLDRALVALAERHEVLRTRFTADGGTPVQVVSDDARAATPSPPVVDLSGLPEATAGLEEGAARVVGEALVARPFDLPRGPVLRTALVRLGPEDHLFVAVFHHIAADGWSLGVFAQELGALYGGLGDALAPLPVQYADFALWQRKHLSGERLDELGEIWRQRLAGLPPALDLPTDRPRPPVQDIRGGLLRFDVSVELTEALNRRAREEGATLFMLMLAAWGALLARWSGEGTIPVGSPIANRRHVEIEGLIGFFVNTLVLPVEVDPAGAFSHLVERVRGTTLGAYAHQDLPFERLVEALQPRRDLSRTPLFQVMVMLHTTAPLELTAGELTLEGTSVHTGISKFDLMLELTERPEVGLVGGIEYATALFDPSTVERLARMLRRVLGAVADGFDGAVAQLPLASPEEIGEVLAAGGFGSRRRRAEEADELLHAPVFARARETPGAPAVVEPDGRGTTYGELAAEAAGLAATLRRRGVGPGAVVALVAEPDRETLVAILGVLAAGAAYLPLDLSYPEERLRFMLEDGGARLLVAPSSTTKRSHDLSGLARSVGVEVVVPDGPAEVGTAPPAADPDPASGAYLLYTSGSTGRPKGVLMPHRTIRRLVDWQVARSRRGGDGGPRRTLQAAPLGFDVSCQEIFSTWAAGGTLVLQPPGLRRDPGEMLAFLAERRIERLFLPFVALAQLAEVAPRVLAAPLEGEPGTTVGDVLADCLGEIVTSGEQLRAEPAVRAFFERLPAAGLDNQYGPTESHVVTAEAVRHPGGSPGAASDPAAWPELPPIGRPAAGALVAVVDPLAFDPLPVGFVGELVLGGQLATGYLGRPAMTALAFVPDPLSGRPGERLYRTGDLARWRRDHRLEFLGRADRQVKIRGYRIEPAEVEVALASEPGVAAAAVVAVPGPGGALRLAAAVVLAPGASSSDDLLAEIKRRLAARLPSFMVPTVFEAVESLPRTPTGKLDRSAVAAALAASPAVPSGAGRPPYEAPRGEHEALVATAFREILEIPETPGRDDDFFELGGHSLLATRLVARLYDELGVEVPLRTVFERPTVAGLAETVVGRGLEEAEDPDLDRLLAELDDLSDEEAERLLAGTILATTETQGGDP